MDLGHIDAMITQFEEVVAHSHWDATQKSRVAARIESVLASMRSVDHDGDTGDIDIDTATDSELFKMIEGELE